MISKITINFHILSYSPYEYDTGEYIEYQNKCCIGCMAAYNYGDYVYFNNMTDNPGRHHIGFIFNQRHGMYITSPLNILEEIFVLFPELI